MMLVERQIPVAIAGPCEDVALPSDTWAVVKLPYDDPETGECLIAEYVRRTYDVGGVAVHAWVWRDVDDREAAREVWLWLLDAAGVRRDDREDATT